ncbi:hypothetical protein [Prosthecodimorpha staleyi]|uniref:Metallo-beta-lactamase domain-containing protein n=1 Tax=Prosthecodimorpha staleyi TaxID=2840188 RepID=A0A947GK42_9HYPH|nr:hypothetical protein [Prosthecodimorpha staleyi]MBT9293089.1 hypothetical protein [Prosthecodimorpha staleyi]
MPAYVTFYPLGNADGALIDLADQRKVLVDFGNEGNPDDPADLRCNLAAELTTNLRKAGRDYLDVVCFTHVDDDHCKGSGAFFWLQHAAKYQGPGRTKINEMWVPACAITEEGLTEDSRLVRQEARHRLREGKGILVFSRAERIKQWMSENSIDYESRKHLFVDAGKNVPGFSKNGPEAVEFFVHCPFAWRQSDKVLVDRNGDSIVFQATFKEGLSESYALFASDVDHEVLSLIVQTTRRHGRDGKLLWDLMKLPHHSSYLSLSSERGVDETVAVDDVKWLFETQGQRGCTIVSTSCPIPAKGSEEDKGTQPPHRQAANHHRRVAREKDGSYIVTMEQPRKGAPAPFRFEITQLGVALLLAAPNVITTATSAPARQG